MRSGPVSTTSSVGVDSATATIAATAGSSPSIVVSVSMSRPYTVGHPPGRPVPTLGGVAPPAAAEATTGQARARTTAA